MKPLTAKERLSNFELLRIIAMFLIVLHHCTYHGILSHWTYRPSVLYGINSFICFFLTSVGEVGTTLFVLLTGYFSCKQDFKLKKWLGLYLRTLFFSIVIFAAALLIDINQTKDNILSFLFPLSHNTYWFITSYLLLYAFSPLLNTVLKETSPKIIKNYLILALALLILLPLLGMCGFANYNSYSAPVYFMLLDGDDGYSVLIYFMFLYLLGGAIRLNYISFSQKTLLKGSISLLIIYLFLGATILIFCGDLIKLTDLFYYVNLNSIYVLVISLWLFYLFKNLKIQSSLINWMAASTFSVYLLHDHPFVRSYLWHTVLKMEKILYSYWFIIWPVVISTCILGLCIILDKLLSIIYKPLINYINVRLVKQLQKHFK